jgi:hypothetical protein
MDFTGTTNVYYLSPAYLLILLVFIGFLYHLIRNREYKNTLPASIIIGIILGLVFNSGGSLRFLLVETLIFIVLVILGGFLAVGFKKLRITNETENFNELENELEGHKKWWTDKTPKIQAMTIIGACLVCLILIIGTISLFNPVENSVEFEIHTIPDGLEDMNYTDNGESIFIVAENSTQYALEGSSEADATVTITSDDLGIYNQTLPLDAENKYAYNLNIPSNVSIIKITLEATKPGKDNRYITFFIKKRL